MDIRETSVPFNKIDLTPKEKREIIEYCKHDVKATVELYKYRQEYIEGKEVLSEMFNIPLATAYRSTNAKLAAIILQAVPKKRVMDYNFVIPERVREYVEKWVPKEVLDMFKLINKDDKEADLFDNHIIYGIGGIHSTLSECIYVCTDDEYQLVNIDVTSYYPNLMMVYNYLSRNVPRPELFREIYDLRVELKRKYRETGNILYKKQQLALKLILNTVYGATLNEYNALYDEHSARSLCYLGQLLLTTLGQELYYTIPGLKVIQTNTDGILVKCPKTQLEVMRKVVSGWEETTGLPMEEDLIDKFFQRDVNNYIECTGNEREPYKLKGKWANQSIDNGDMANLNAPICHIALLNYYTKGIPIRDTINECYDPLLFCFTAKMGRTYSECYHFFNEQRIPANKVNRVYATTDRRYGTLRKKKRDDMGVEHYDKIAEIPMNCGLMNGELDIPFDLDREWYVEFATKKMKELMVA